MIYIYGVAYSNFVRSVQLACALKGLPSRLGLDLGGETIPFKSAQHYAIHPLGKLPVIQDGDIRVAESQAILRYLDTAYPEIALQPEGLAAKAEHDMWCSLIASHIDHALIRTYMVEFVRPSGKDGEPDTAKMLSNKAAADAAIQLLELRLQEVDFVCGDQATLADCLLAPLLHYSSRLTGPLRLLEESSPIHAYLKRVMALTGVDKILV